MMNFIIKLVKAPVLFFLGATLLFIVGYASYLIFGADKPIEEVCELLLRQIFKIDIEFSN
jgi:hypothetical protein